MANDVFSVASDVEVSLYTYASDVFIWGITRWNDGDKWDNGTATESWQPITCEVSYVRTSNGVTVEQGLIRPEPATADIVYQSSSFDPFTNSQVRSGTPIRIRVRPNPDTAPTTWVTLFQGKIETASASYEHDWRNTVSLTCITDLRDYLNFTALEGLVTVNPAYAADYFTAMNTAYGSALVSASGAPDLVGYQLEGIDSIDPVEFGSIVTQLLDSNLGALVYKPITDPTFHYYYTWNELRNKPEETNVDFESAASANTKRAEFANITIGFDTAEVVNTVNYTTTLGYANTRENAEGIALQGSLALDVETLHYNDADADTWAQELSLALPARRVQSVECPVVLRSGQVNENLLREPFDVASVTANNSRVIIDETYYITNIVHEITPDYWNGFYDLWTGR
jgi:hypothetical protein